MNTWAAKLVVRGLAPDAPLAPGHIFPAVAERNIYGRAAEGGLGVLNLRGHLAALRVKTLLQLVFEDDGAP